MNWDHVEDEDDDFFEPGNRFSFAVPDNLESSRSDEDFEDARLLFSTVVYASARPSLSLNNSISGAEAVASAATKPCSASKDYDMWMAEPNEVKECRHRLLQGMGLLSNNSIQKIASAKKFARVITRKAETAVTTAAFSPVRFHAIVFPTGAPLTFTPGCSSPVEGSKENEITFLSSAQF